VVYVWYLAIFGWGWLFIIEIRVLVISLLAPGLARQIFAEEQAAKTPSGAELSTKFNCITCALIPTYSVSICLDILYLIDIKKNPNQHLPMSVETPAFTQVKEVEMFGISDSKARRSKRRKSKQPKAVDHQIESSGKDY